MFLSASCHWQAMLRGAVELNGRVGLTCNFQHPVVLGQKNRIILLVISYKPGFPCQHLVKFGFIVRCYPARLYIRQRAEFALSPVFVLQPEFYYIELQVANRADDFLVSGLL